MTNQELVKLGRKYLMPIFAREEIAMVKGDGVYLYDADGKEYLDFLAGIAVNNLGYNHPAVSQAIDHANKTILHSSNYFWIEPQIKLAEILVENSVFDQAFFANSGAEANEGAIKLARKYGQTKRNPNATNIVTATNSFHGRTLATLAATGQEKFHQDFKPNMPGFSYVEFNNLEAIKYACDDHTAAIMIELIQGEGGVVPADQDYVTALADFCKEKNILLIVDEVQTGIGRTGKLFAYEHYGIEPDIISLAKGLGNGVPIGAVLAKKEVAEVFKPGDHGTTFGGNHLATSAGLATVQTVVSNGFLDKVGKISDYFTEQLSSLKEKHAVVKEVRGEGLLLALVLGQESKPVYQECLNRGLIISATAGNVLRFVPPLIIEEDDVDKAIVILDEVLESLV